MDTEKYNFVTTEFSALLQNLKPDTIPAWGQMNAQQMVEHVSDFMRISSGRTKVEVLTPEDKLPAFKNFLNSDKQFRPDTKNPLNTGAPLAVRKENMQAAISELQDEIKNFVETFEKNPQLKTAHPAFGYCDFEEWIKLHYKHLSHHARQFGLMQ
jgi:hypothetical protein